MHTKNDGWCGADTKNDGWSGADTKPPHGGAGGAVRTPRHNTGGETFEKDGVQTSLKACLT